jgi:hypothetical protein
VPPGLYSVSAALSGFKTSVTSGVQVSTLYTFGRWALDGNLSKNFQIGESKSVQIRFDAKNILNHPTPTDPVGLTNTGSSFQDNFGQITSKTGSRTFQGRLRFSF